MAMDEKWRFMPTRATSDYINRVGLITSFSCCGLACLVLLWATALWLDKRTRHVLERKSSQMLLACVFASAIYGGLYALTNLESGSFACRFEMFFVILAFEFMNWLQLCISLNLIMALYCPGVYRYNVHLAFYASSFFVALGLAIGPLVANVYRWSPVTNSCWLTSEAAEAGDFDYWQLAVIEIPLLLGTIVMTVSLIMVAYRFFWDKKHEGTAPEMLNQLFEPAVANDNFDVHASAEGTVSSRFQITEIIAPPGMNISPLMASHHPHRPSESIFSGFSQASTNSRGRAMKMPRLGNITEEDRKVRVARLPVTPNFGQNPVTESSQELRKTVWRIAIYPVLHLILATSGAVGQLMLQASENRSEAYQTRLFLLISQLSAWVPLAYILPALFADTSLIDGLREWIRLRREIGEPDLEVALGKNAHLEVECDVITITHGKSETRSIRLDDWSQSLHEQEKKP
ncbi:hypothetical protein BCR37DRAFT_384650 [Protomyces lactucae-debilis]|uniref:G-protein coupled receptors family 2 profile 2 domain-containing protein n=1 Tax=Protomyces lactucae-debilis TaxID=2754530 RepID=A0A1Y2ESV6_PROLT|nr:uncharacterized protein BCR37DRAFT_384650 [Protomyces lactucae-debilis]ORY73925.1 hypothetical protein BCR37DRAFT_384650 [Protomyces lactucae-debilis]